MENSSITTVMTRKTSISIELSKPNSIMVEYRPLTMRVLKPMKLLRVSWRLYIGRDRSSPKKCNPMPLRIASKKVTRKMSLKHL